MLQNSTELCECFLQSCLQVAWNLQENLLRWAATWRNYRQQEGPFKGLGIHNQQPIFYQINRYEYHSYYERGPARLCFSSCDTTAPMWLFLLEAHHGPLNASQTRLSTGAGGGLPQGPSLSPALQRPRLEPAAFLPQPQGLSSGALGSAFPKLLLFITFI